MDPLSSLIRFRDLLPFLVVLGLVLLLLLRLVDDDLGLRRLFFLLLPSQLCVVEEWATLRVLAQAFHA